MQTVALALSMIRRGAPPGLEPCIFLPKTSIIPCFCVLISYEEKAKQNPGPERAIRIC